MNAYPQTEALEGQIERITYYAESSGYTVLQLKAPGQPELITVVGELPQTYAGERVRLRGQWLNHPKYGPQFKARHCEKLLPATVTGLEKYLASGLIKGVGPITARRMVKAFGVEIIEVIEHSPERLLEIPLIGPRKRDLIVQSWQAHKEIQNIMVFLQDHGVSTAFAVKIYKRYGNEAIEVVQNNPYQLAEDVWGIGFKTADTLASHLGLDAEHPARLQAGLRYALYKASESGHVYLPQPELFQTTAALLEVSTEPLPAALDAMVQRQQLRLEGAADCPDVFLSPLWQAESGIAQQLAYLQRSALAHRVSTEDVSRWLQAYEARHKLQFSQQQREAVIQAATYPIFILTGGPGTGKTTVSRAILDWFAEQQCRLLLASPTGRAAKRLSEVSGREAQTLHRLLAFDPRKMAFKHNEYNPLELDLLLLDEVSMIDTALFYQLLKAMPGGARLILVGDSDQLPSVGPGAVLKDLLASGQVPAVILNQIFRQAQASQIIRNAHSVNQGQMPQLLPPLPAYRQADAFFIAVDTPEQLQQQILELVNLRLPKAGYQPDDIQVLCPMNRGLAGARQLNLALQEALNPATGQPELVRAARTLRVGDRVIQLRNNYDREVFNGDLGTVIGIDPEEQLLSVRYPEQDVHYDFSEQDELTLAYALTIHKSQGSEFPVVVLPMMMQHYLMLQRNLLYTGMTRARRLLVLVGQTKAIALAVKNQQGLQRYTRLAERLQNGSF
ncbi:MAG: ATP-dependent RecD-like DNA helicase [Candidatus Sericytochromatia bacterium]|nr:ATP-dependent RecD-like DNA helicase [Candidatus Sericytochromatia bacterium]